MKKEYKDFIDAAGLNPANFRWAWAFENDGDQIDNPVGADELAALVLSGKKRATASALAGYEADEPLPAADGKFDILLNGAGQPVAALRTTKVYIVKFGEVSAAHAFKEGEGLAAQCAAKNIDEVSEDYLKETLSWWRQAHQKFWESFDLFSPDMDIVCEEFEVLYQIN